MKRAVRVEVTLIALILLLVAASTVSAQPVPQLVLQDREDAKQSADAPARRAHPVVVLDVNPAPELSADPDLIELRLGAKLCKIRKTRIEKRGRMNLTWFGRLQGQNGTAVLTLVDDAIYGRIETENEIYVIEPSLSAYLLGSDQVGSDQAFEAGSPVDDILVPPALPDVVTDYAGGEDGSQIDLLVFYTSQLSNRYTTSLPGLIQHYVDVANSAYVNSGVNTHLRLVGVQPYAGTGALEGVDPCTAVGAITTEPAIATARDAAKADIVALLRLFTSSACGCGYIMQDVSSWFEAYAFSVVEVRPIWDANPSYCQETTLTHELGHNMGCAHDRDHASQPGAYSYSYGHDRPGTFATIMSYDQPRITYFSTPQVSYSGFPIGIPEGQPNSADNARTINNTRTLVANFRIAEPPDLAITKTHVGSFFTGQSGQYLLAISNNGAASTSAPITVTDTLPAGLTFISAVGSGWTCSAIGANVECDTNQSLVSGSPSTITLTVSIGSAAMPSVSNTATVSCADDVYLGNNTSIDIAPVSQGGDWTIGGYLGVGTTAPERAVHVKGSNAVFRMDRTVDTAAFILTRTDGLANPLKSFVVGANASGVNLGEFIINDIGAAVGGAGQRRMTISNGGDMIFGGSVIANQFLSPSSLRFKTNIRLLDDPASKLKHLNGVRFDWKNTGITSLGLVAEEVGQVFPELVFPDAKAVEGVSYDGVVAVLVQAVSERKRQIQTLREKQGKLNQLLEQLKARQTSRAEQ